MGVESFILKCALLRGSEHAVGRGRRLGFEMEQWNPRHKLNIAQHEGPEKVYEMLHGCF